MKNTEKTVLWQNISRCYRNECENLNMGVERNEMLTEKESVNLFIELQSMEDCGVGIWMEGKASSPKAVAKALAVNEESAYMRDYVYEKGVLKRVEFDKIKNQ